MVTAQQGCCSWHGGVSHCDSSVGRKVCNDGTYSPSCTCYRSAPVFVGPTATPYPEWNDMNVNMSYNQVIQADGLYTLHLNWDGPSIPYSYFSSRNKGDMPDDIEDIRASRGTVTDIRSGMNYITIRKKIDGYWSTPLMWELDIPDITPSPTPIPPPTRAPEPTIFPQSQTPPPNELPTTRVIIEGILSIISLPFKVLGII